MLVVTFFSFENLKEELIERHVFEVRIAEFKVTKKGNLGYYNALYVCVSAYDPKDELILYSIELVGVVHELSSEEEKKRIAEKFEQRVTEIKELFKDFRIRKGMYADIIRIEKLS